MVKSAVELDTVTRRTPASIHGRAAAAVGAHVPVATPRCRGTLDDVGHRLDDRRVTGLARYAEVLRQVERADEDEVEAGDAEDPVERGQPVRSLDLHAGDDAGLGLLAVVRERHGAVAGRANVRRRTALAARRVVGRRHHGPRLLDTADAGGEDAVGTGVERRADLAGRHV